MNKACPDSQTVVNYDFKLSFWVRFRRKETCNCVCKTEMAIERQRYGLQLLHILKVIFKNSEESVFLSSPRLPTVSVFHAMFAWPSAVHQYHCRSPSLPRVAEARSIESDYLTFMFTWFQTLSCSDEMAFDSDWLWMQNTALRQTF